MSLSLLVLFFLHQFIHCNYHDYSKWVKMCSNSHCWIQVTAYFPQNFVHGQSCSPCLMSNDIVLKIRNNEVLNIYIIYIYIYIYIYIDHLPPITKGSTKIWPQYLWAILKGKMEDGNFWGGGEWDKNRHSIYNTTAEYFV